MLFLSAAAVATVIAAATDVWKFKVPNALTFPTLAAGLAASAWVGGWGGLATSGLGALTGFGLLVAFFAMGGVGAGDVKLLTALGAWLGPWLTVHVFLASAIAAGLYAFVLSILGGGLAATAVDLLFLTQRMRRGDFSSQAGPSIAVEAARGDRRRRLVPFAATTCLGFFVTVFWWRPGLDEPRVLVGSAPAVAAASSFEGPPP
ncbi:A24 family peptidase [Paludisphaera mucosa]|uniref:A24 family peptidase n=1 Tax=Paludisphaera mucosa TaxID=3030827 RepID=A0ABT6FBJ4_9BACT|nr:A24 family peptidase [Paludisphaera mucosa]MDG3004750.1 A24 family peptidase [Paludisphaera mucosa]